MEVTQHYQQHQRECVCRGAGVFRYLYADGRLMTKACDGTDNSLRELIEAAADYRISRKKNFRSRRVLNNDYELIGMFGEAAFAIEFGLPIDLRYYEKGDGDVDFIVKDMKIDVKTMQPGGRYLLVEANRKSPHADIYVLAEYNCSLADLRAWEYGSIMVKIPPVEWPRNILNHRKLARDCRPMEELSKMLGNSTISNNNAG